MLIDDNKEILNIIKKRCYITTSIYDDEITSLINSCILDCIEAGVDKKVFSKKGDNYDDLILNCITNYVKAYRGNDRSNTNQYMEMYESIRNKLTLLKNYNTGDSNEL